MSRLKDKYESLRPLIVWLGLMELAWISYWLLRPSAASGYAAMVVDIAHNLQTTHPISVRYEARDLSEPGSASHLWNDLAHAGMVIDVLVNNAGSGIYGKLEDVDGDALEKMLQVNVVALTALARLALPGMKARGWGRILNVGSVVGYQPAGPRMAAYFASKAYVLSFSKALARELAGTGVKRHRIVPRADGLVLWKSAPAPGERFCTSSCRRCRLPPWPPPVTRD